jgi:hypothetical protein
MWVNIRLRRLHNYYFYTQPNREAENGSRVGNLKFIVMASTITTGVKKCKPFLLRVMIFSPESGYKFTIEIQKACNGQNEPVWKLLFDLYKKTGAEFQEVVCVEFVAGDPNDIEKIAAITEDGMKRSQVRSFRDDVYPLVKSFGDSGKKPGDDQKKKIDDSMKKAINA